MSNSKTIYKNVSQKRKADTRNRKHQAFINHDAINVNDTFINLKVRDNINIIPESTEIINHKNKNDSDNAYAKYKKIKKKPVLVIGDSMVNSIKGSKLSKTRHNRAQPIPGGKIEDIQQNLKNLLHEDRKQLLSMPVPVMQQPILHK